MSEDTPVLFLIACDGICKRGGEQRLDIMYFIIINKKVKVFTGKKLNLYFQGTRRIYDSTTCLNILSFKKYL